jgi:hypothetical protein
MHPLGMNKNTPKRDERLRKRALLIRAARMLMRQLETELVELRAWRLRQAAV